MVYPKTPEVEGQVVKEGDIHAEVEEQEIVIRRFHGSVDLSAARMERDAGQIADEVLSHLSGLVGANVNSSLEIDVEVPDEIPDNIIRIVKENASTLKFKAQGFEEE